MIAISISKSHAAELLGPYLYAPALLVFAAVPISMLRYRLWDIDIFISRALVCSTLAAGLAIIAAGVSGLLVQALAQGFGEQSLTIAVLVSILPVAAGFVPLRDLLQRVVDRVFKPEQVNLTGTFVEFTPEVRTGQLPSVTTGARASASP